MNNEYIFKKLRIYIPRYAAVHYFLNGKIKKYNYARYILLYSRYYTYYTSYIKLSSMFELLIKKYKKKIVLFHSYMSMLERNYKLCIRNAYNDNIILYSVIRKKI